MLILMLSKQHKRPPPRRLQHGMRVLVMSEACMFFMSEIVFVYVRMFIKNRKVTDTYLTVDVLAG